MVTDFNMLIDRKSYPISIVSGNIPPALNEMYCNAYPVTKQGSEPSPSAHIFTSFPKGPLLKYAQNIPKKNASVIERTKATPLVYRVKAILPAQYLVTFIYKGPDVVQMPQSKRVMIAFKELKY